LNFHIFPKNFRSGKVLSRVAVFRSSDPVFHQCGGIFLSGTLSSFLSFFLWKDIFPRIHFLIWVVLGTPVFICVGGGFLSAKYAIEISSHEKYAMLANLF